MDIKFGGFIVNKNGILCNDHYLIDADRLWETRDFKGVLLWDWLIHLTEKTWVNAQTVGDLNTAFFFAQDIFKNQKPIHASEGSTFQTLYVQRRMIEIDEKIERNKPKALRKDGLNYKDFRINDDDFNIEDIEDIELL